MIIRNKDNWREQVVTIIPKLLWVCICTMFAGFFWSRALLSIGMLSFCTLSIITAAHIPFSKLRHWQLGVLWVLALSLTAFWSENLTQFSTLLAQKIPLLFLPIAFRTMPALSIQSKRWLTLIVSIMAWVGMLHTLMPLVSNAQNVIANYGSAQVLPTPVYGDYVRFSLFLALWSNWVFYTVLGEEKSIGKKVLVAFLIFTILFLHVLAARTGLVCLYLSLLVWLTYFFMNGYRRTVVLSTLIIMVLGIGAVLYIPTLNNRFHYMKYTIEEWQQGNAGNQYSDVGRWSSIKAGAVIFAEHPLTGVGLGDVLMHSKEEYHKSNPSEQRNLLPHNQFLLFAAAGGLFVLLPFIIWVLYPFQFVRRTKAGFHLLATLLMLLVILLIEPVLEVQMGVFVYLFFLYWALKEKMQESIFHT